MTAKDAEVERLRAENTSMRVELARLFGETKEHHGMTWWACMLARIGERLADNERLREALQGVTNGDGCWCSEHWKERHDPALHASYCDNARAALAEKGGG